MERQRKRNKLTWRDRKSKEMQTYNSLDQSNRKKYTRKDIERLPLRILQANKIVQR